MQTRSKDLDIRVFGVIITVMAKENFDKKKIDEAKEKLACHIGPQKTSMENTERVRLTELTSAGG